MLLIAYYLMDHPLVAVGLGILFLVCIHNILRRQVRIAAGLWVLILVVLMYTYVQAVGESSGTSAETDGAEQSGQTVKD